MDLCKKNSFISTFSLIFWLSNLVLSDALILPVSQFQTQHDKHVIN